MITVDKRGPRDKRHHRLRRWVRGTGGKPRLAVFRSLNHIYAQIIDDDTGRTLAAADSRSKEFRSANPKGGNVAAAKAVGALLAQRAKSAGLTQVVFDGGRYQYDEPVEALPDPARAGGLVF